MRFDFADVSTKITIMENILHAFSLNKNDPESLEQSHKVAEVTPKRLGTLQP